MATAATEWASDLDLVAPTDSLRRGEAPPRRRPVAHGRDHAPDLMRLAAKRRRRKVEDRIGGRGSAWHKVAHAVARHGDRLEAVAARLGMARAVALRFLQEALADVAAVYRPEAGGRAA